MGQEEQFEVDVDGENVFGVLHSPANENKHPLVLIVHGWSANRMGPARFFVDAARDLVEEGYAVARFDFRGSGDSSREFEEQTHTSMLEDLESVISELQDRENIDEDRVALIGHSQGGYISTLYAGSNNIEALILWMARTTDLENWFSKPWKRELKRKGYYTYQGYKQTKEYYKDGLEYDAGEALRNIENPIGMIYGEMDETVPPSESQRVEENAAGETELEIMDYLDHLFHGEENQEAVKDQTREWLEKWIS